MRKSFNKQELEGLPPDTAGDLLEEGNVVEFTHCPIELPSPADLETLRRELPGQLKRKNVSYHPEADRVQGLKENSPVAGLAHQTLTNHRNRVTRFLEEIMPTLTRNMRVGTCSFRPIQERGRNLKAHASNELVHLDAGAYGATNGDRLLRFFVNVNPEEDRVWSSKGALPELLLRYGKQAGMTAAQLGGLEKTALDRLRSAALGGLAEHGLPLAKILDNSPYDRAMRRFHNFMKDTPAFQQDPVGHEEMRFKPYTAWMVFTDMLSHACLSGQHALIYTAVLPVENCRKPELAPINLLRKAA